MTVTSTHLSADPSIGDVVWAAYKGGVTSDDDTSPIVPAAAADGCARCGYRTPEMTPVGQVISKRFTGYSSWTNSAARTLCAACTWAYRTPALRSAAHLVTRGPATLTTLTPTNLNKCWRARSTLGQRSSCRSYPAANTFSPKHSGDG
ncbi:hypothetical protein [Prescottella equi]